MPCCGIVRNGYTYGFEKCSSSSLWIVLLDQGACLLSFSKNFGQEYFPCKCCHIKYFTCFTTVSYLEAVLAQMLILSY